MGSRDVWVNHTENGVSTKGERGGRERRVSSSCVTHPLPAAPRTLSHSSATTLHSFLESNWCASLELGKKFSRRGSMIRLKGIFDARNSTVYSIRSIPKHSIFDEHGRICPRLFESSLLIPSSRQYHCLSAHLSRQNQKTGTFKVHPLLGTSTGD